MKPKFSGLFFEKHCPVELDITTYCWEESYLALEARQGPGTQRIVGECQASLETESG